MRTSFRKFILDLPGPNSYCDCSSICSNLEIEHVYPKSLLRKKLTPNLFGIANKNPHNLYRCCSFLNRKKAALLLGRDYDASEFNGMLARSCLYMDYTYQLGTDSNLLMIWKNYSLLYPPMDFEFERDREIKKYVGVSNPFISNFT